MALTFTRWTYAVLLSAAALGSASAAPALPSPSLAAQAVRSALAPAAPAPVKAAPTAQAPQPARQVARPVQAPAARPAATQVSRPAQAPAARPAPAQAARPAQTQTARVTQTPAARTQTAQAAQTRAQNIQQVQAGVTRTTTRTGRSVIARATAYNSLAGQTDSTPFITATGTRTRPGVVALSRDLLRVFPYGTRVTIEDLSGRSGGLFRGRVFIVEDTMAARKTGSIDVWMASYSDAIRFGARQVRITAVR